MTALVSALLLLAAPAPAAAAALDAAVIELYRPYRRQPDATAVWERPIFSRETTALIARWRKLTPRDEPDELSDGDWLCLCQDWDQHRFRAVIRSRQRLSGDRAGVVVGIDLGFGKPRRAELRLRREAGAWKLDDLVAADFPRGLKQALRDTIARDRRRPR